MGRIFISYRRSDSPDIVGRIYDRLVESFGASAVFRDLDSIPLGVSFPLFLQQALESTQVVLVVIGPGWLKASDASGRRRLDDPADFVRLEVESALRSHARVVPITVGAASLPAANELPETCRDLTSRNGLSVRGDPDFHNDMNRLISEIQTAIGQAPSVPRVGLVDRLETGIQRFFRYQGQFAPEPPLVFGEAKAIVRRFAAETDVFQKVAEEIERRKREDANWTYANMLNAGLALVNSLGLAPDTAEENRAFLLLPLPEKIERQDA